ncbi:GNAT family protein [Nonomuraea longicatena]|uniref:GNAT family protein n=1 Tax=Nonomuraea longicatena TaxID=83682 RepID=A0ABP3ZSS0_9ACTN
MIRIRAFEPADAPRVASWIDDERALYTWSGNSGFTLPGLADQLTAFYAADPTRRGHTALTPSGAVVGHFMLRDLPDRETVRLGFVLISPETRGQGYGEAMLRAAVRTAFADPSAQRVSLGVYPHNQGALRLYERLGFATTGTEEKIVEVDGAWWSSYQMTLGRQE